jgi:amino acid transporter
MYIIFGNLAAEAMQFGVAMQGLIQPTCTEGQECFSRVKVLGWAVGLVTPCAVITATITRKWFVGVNHLLAVAKVMFLAEAAIVGTAYGTRNGNTCRSVSWDTKGEKTTSAGDIMLALLLVMYAYTGFGQPFYALAKVRRLREVFASSVANAMLSIMPLVIIGYMCAISYRNSGSLPKNIAVAIFGLLAPVDSFGAILSIFILGSILAQTFTSFRFIQEIAKEGILPSPWYSRFFAPGKRSLLSRPRVLRRQNRPGEETYESTLVIATFLYWVPIVVLLVLFGMAEEPSLSYTLLRSFSVTAILGLAPFAGLLYLRVDSSVVGINRNWKSQVQWHPWLNPIPACVATLASGLLIFGAFATPAQITEDNPLPYWAVPLLGLGVPILGVVWWTVLRFVQWRGDGARSSRIMM